MRRRNILFMTSWYPTHEKPGWGVFVREHAKAVRLYHDVSVLHCPLPFAGLRSLTRFEQVTDETLTEGILTYRVQCRRWASSRVTDLFYIWSVWRAFRRIVADGDHPDVLHAHIYEAGVPAAVIGRRFRIPLVVTEHYSVFPRRLLVPREVQKAERAFRSAKWVLPVSQVLRQAIEAYGITAHFRVVPNAVDVSLFYPDRENKTVRRPQHGLLWVGALIPLKGLDHLLRALAQLRRQRVDWQLDIIGDGPQRSEYERLATELGLAEGVTFHGYKPKLEVAEFMRRADLFVLSSLFETFSAVCAEALASGLPVLATRCGGPEDFIGEDVGRLVPPGDSDALARALSEMLDNLTGFSPTRLAQYAAERFSYERVGAQLDAIYDEVA